MTINELQGFLAFMVKNNEQGVIDAIKSLGYTPESTKKGLVDQLMNIYSTKGTTGLNQVFSKVSVDKNKATQDELISIYELTTGEKVDTSSAKFTWADFQSLWAGSTVTTGATSTTSSKPALSPTAVIITAVIAIIAIVVIWKIS